MELPARVSAWLLQLVTSQRAVAHVLIDGEHRVAGKGGDLRNYGLAGLELRQFASTQMPFLEGLLPLPESPFLIPSLEMPGGRVADVHLVGDDESTWIVLLDVTGEHGEARKIQQKAYDMTLLSQREARLLARLQAAHDELTTAHRELGESRAALIATHSRLEQELREAERYVRAILPPPMTQPFSVEWRYIPSTELGGDSLGYHWVDSEHFALYLLDVCGHGVGSALLSVAVANALRSGALADTDFRRPDEVLGSLNRVYQMETQDDLYFTIWYGVYEPRARRLTYASAGHPPPLVVHGANAERGVVTVLEGRGPALGVLPNVRYQAQECALTAPSRLFLFSDGVYEVTAPDGSMLDYAAFVDAVAAPVREGVSELDALLRLAQAFKGSATLEDDFSIVKLAV